MFSITHQQQTLYLTAKYLILFKTRNKSGELFTLACNHTYNKAKGKGIRKKKLSLSINETGLYVEKCKAEFLASMRISKQLLGLQIRMKHFL